MNVSVSSFHLHSDDAGMMIGLGHVDQKRDARVDRAWGIDEGRGAATGTRATNVSCIVAQICSRTSGWAGIPPGSVVEIHVFSILRASCVCVWGTTRV